jgi:hypothetical protein
MYQEQGHSHYSTDEIKEMFQSELSSKQWQINQSEYDQFCKLISCLKAEHVNLLRDEIHIVIFSDQKEIDWNDKIVFACYINLRDEELLNKKKGVIFLSPDFLSLEHGYITLKKLYHEIAHHTLDHRTAKTEDEIREKEEAADKQAYEWLLQENRHLENCQREPE